MHTPVVSVLLPVYNGARFIREAVTSICNQQFADFEIIVVDDGSTDATVEILESVADPRLVILRQKRNSGIVPTLNAGLARCRGKYVARMDADDIAVPSRLGVQVAYFEQHPEVGVVDCVQEIVDEKGQPVGRTNSSIVEASDILRTLPKLNCLGHPSVMVRTELLQKYSYRQVPYEDYDLWLRMAYDGIGIFKLKDRLLHFRSHESSITGSDAVNTKHFLKIIQTKRFYLSKLSFAAALHPFNLAVRAWLLRDIATHWFKKFKLIFSH